MSCFEHRLMENMLSPMFCTITMILSSSCHSTWIWWTLTTCLSESLSYYNGIHAHCEFHSGSTLTFLRRMQAPFLCLSQRKLQISKLEFSSLSSHGTSRSFFTSYFLLMNTQQVKEVLIIPDAVYIFSHFNSLKVRLSICPVPYLVNKISVMKLTQE